MPDWRVAICVNGYDGIKASLVSTLLDMGLCLGAHVDTKYLPILVPRLNGPTCLNAGISLAQEAIDAADVREPLTHILWMDRDTVLTSDGAIRLLESVDPWHPAVFAVSRDPDHLDLPNLWTTSGERMTDWPDDTLVRVRSAGLAAAAFDADLFYSLRQPWFRWQAEPGGNPQANVCYQFAEQRIPVFCHTGVTVRQAGKAPVYESGVKA